MKLSDNDILTKIKNKCELKNYTFIKFIGPISIKSYFILKCNIDNYEWKSCYKNFIYQNGCCHKCAGNAPYTKELLLEKILKKCKENNYTFLYMNDFSGNKTKFKLKCDKDEYEWATDFHTFIDSDCGCKKCYGNIALTEDEYMNNIYNICSSRNYTYLGHDIWIGNKTKFRLRCNIDNHEWFIRYDSFITNNIGCPKCSDKSKYAEIFENKLKQLNIFFRKEKTYCDLKNINLLRFDYIINEALLVELDGNEHKNKNNKVFLTDRMKEKYCIDNNLKLIRINNKDIKNVNIRDIV